CECVCLCVCVCVCVCVLSQTCPRYSHLKQAVPVTQSCPLHSCPPVSLVCDRVTMPHLCCQFRAVSRILFHVVWRRSLYMPMNLNPDLYVCVCLCVCLCV